MMPNGEWHRCMKEECSNDIVDRFYMSLDFSVLRGSMRTRETKKYAIVIKKLFKSAIDIFRAIITLKILILRSN